MLLEARAGEVSKMALRRTLLHIDYRRFEAESSCRGPIMDAGQVVTKTGEEGAAVLAGLARHYLISSSEAVRWSLSRLHGHGLR